MKNKHLKEPTVSEDSTSSENQSSEEDADETNNSKTHQLTFSNRLEESTTKHNLSSNDISEEQNNLMCSPKTKKTEFSDYLDCNESAVRKSTFSLEELNSDDEIYTFGYPENFCVKGLLDHKILLDCVYKITDNQSDDIFKLQVLDSKNSFLTLALPSQKLGGCLVNLPLKGKILIQESKDLPLEYESVQDDETKNEIKYFENTKVRHPLIGADWKNHISLAEAIIKNKSLKRKSKKFKREVEEESQASSSEISPRKKKKRKHLDTQD